jgi:hypothetical protein
MRLVLVLCLVARTAGAAGPDGGDDAARLEVAVGETVERDVGIAMGLRCDDLAIVRVDLRTATPESNRFEVTGVRPGTTRCRVGTSIDRPSFVFEIHVVPAPRS